MENSIINEIGGVPMKTLEEIKPVIDEAVASAGAVREEISDAKERASDKDGIRIESGISVQDVPAPTPGTEVLEASDPGAEIAAEAEQERGCDGPDL